MNFNDSKVRRVISIVILLIVVAMLATAILPYLA